MTLYLNVETSGATAASDRIRLMAGNHFGAQEITMKTAGEDLGNPFPMIISLIRHSP